VAVRFLSSWSTPAEGLFIGNEADALIEAGVGKVSFSVFSTNLNSVANT